MQQPPSPAAPRVLVVDDDEDSCIIYERFLELAGFETSNARSAVEAFMRASSSPPSAVLLDLVLPDMHGSELALLFRSTPALEHVPIVGITARVTPELLKEPATVPVTRLLIKPTTSRQLVGAIREAIEVMATAAAASRAVSGDAERPQPAA